MFPRQIIHSHSNPSLCPKHYAKEAEADQFYEDLQDILELSPKRDVLFIIADWNAKVGIFPRFHAKVRAVLAKKRERTESVRQTYWH